jgi:nucleotide-binding universal stress UspA family protein
MAAPIVVGFDGSDCSRAALARALELGKGTGAPVVAAFGYAPSRLGGEVSDFAAALREAGEKVLSEATHQAQAAGSEIDVVLVDDRPAEALTGLADERDAQMVVVGTYGMSPLKGAILGSTAYRLLGLSERPVLVVPVPE